MNVPKHIEKLIKYRRDLGYELNAADAEITNWMTEHGVEFTQQFSDFGCMILTEPSIYAQKTLEAIESK